MRKGIAVTLIMCILSIFFTQCVVEDPSFTVRVVYKNQTNTDVDFHAYFSYEFSEFDDLKSPFKTKILSGEQYTQETIVDPLGVSITPFIGSDSILFIFHDSLKLKFDYHKTTSLKDPIGSGNYELETSGSGKDHLVVKTFFITQEHLDSAKVIRE